MIPITIKAKDHGLKKNKKILKKKEGEKDKENGISETDHVITEDNVAMTLSQLASQCT